MDKRRIHKPLIVLVGLVCSHLDEVPRADRNKNLARVGDLAWAALWLESLPPTRDVDKRCQWDLNIVSLRRKLLEAVLGLLEAFSGNRKHVHEALELVDLLHNVISQ